MNCYFGQKWMQLEWWSLSESELHSTTKLNNMHAAHKTIAARWPPSGSLPSGHLPQAFKRAFPKQPSLYHDYQLPDHLYISMRITLIKAPMQVNSYNQLSVMPLHYKSHNLRWWGLSNHTYNSLIYSNVHIRNVEGWKRTLPNAQMLAPNCICQSTNA